MGECDETPIQWLDYESAGAAPLGVRDEWRLFLESNWWSDVDSYQFVRTGTYGYKTQKPVIPKEGLTVGLEEGTRRLKWKLTGEASRQERSVGSSGVPSSVSEGTVPHLAIWKTPHDLICDLFSGGDKTDVPIMKVLGTYPDGCDWRTPDLLYMATEEDVACVEVTTTSILDPSSAVSVFNTKAEKYLHPIYNRVRSNPKLKSWVLTVLVGPDYVLSSLPLPGNYVPEIMSLCKLGQMIVTQAREQGFFVSETREERSMLMNDVLKELENFKLDPDDVEGITPAYRDNLLKGSGDNIFVVQAALNDIISLSEDSLEEGNYRDSFLRAKKELELKIQTKARCRKPKAIVQFPLVVPALEAGSDVPYGFTASMPPKTPPIVEIWEAAMSARSTSAGFPSEDVSSIFGAALITTPEEQDHLSDENKKRKKEWHRVVIDQLSGEAQRYLLMNGVGAKRYKNEEQMKDRRIETQVSFALDCPTHDIQKLVRTAPSFYKLPPALSPEIELIEKANEITGNSNVGLNSLNKAMESDHFAALKTISCIATELIISLKQNVKPNQWIIKKVRGLGVTILIHPTRSDSHIFFSLRFEPGFRVLEEGVFRQVHIQGDGRGYTDIVSSNKGRLENQMLAPYIWLSSLVHWQITMGALKENINNFSALDMHMVEMTWISVLTALDDRETTEELITSSRYFMMELLKGSDDSNVPDLAKMVPKMPSCFRSRLPVYLYHKMMDSYVSMLENPPCLLRFSKELDIESDYRGDEWDGLLNPLTGLPLSSAKEVIEVIYAGYSRNKNNPAQGNSAFKLVKKILSKCFDCDPEMYPVYRLEKQAELEDQNKPHNVSRAHLHAGVNLVIDRLRTKLGDDFQESLKTSILEALLREGAWEKYATFKASFNYDPKGDGVCKAKAPHPSHKCIEAVVSMSKNDTRLPHQMLHQIASRILENSGGVCCYIFKKEQHGGTREIYVMDMDSRIVQHFLETVSREVCRHFPEEILCNPQNKFKLIEEHYRRVGEFSSKMVGVDITRLSSEDKSTWNQNFFVYTFMYILTNILPREFVDPVLSCLRLWLSKRLRLPQDVQKMLISDDFIDDEAYRVLRRAAHRQPREDDPPEARELFDRVCGDFIKVRSGMWQGILHVCSSLTHLVQTLHYKYLMRAVMGSMVKGLGAFEFVITTMVSSDDSATLISAIVPSSMISEAKKKIDRILVLACKFEAKHCLWFQMQPSPKSCYGAKHVLEFNSNFLFKRGFLNPLSKFVYASLYETECETFTQRHQTCYNLLKDMVEAGMSHHQVHLMQLIQGFIAYDCLGAASAPCYPNWREMLLDAPDPALGFFPVDLDLIAGIMGYSFCHWLAVRDTNLPITVPLPKTLRSGQEPGINTQITIQLLYGNASRWKKLVRKAVEGVDEPSEEEKAKVLFHGVCRDERDLQVMLLMKARSSGAYQSMRYGGSIINMVSSGVYATSTPCVTLGTADLLPGEEDSHSSIEKYRIKRSLICITQSYLNYLRAPDKSVVTYRNCSKDLLISQFPRDQVYKEIRSMVYKWRSHGFLDTAVQNYRKKKNEIVFETSRFRNSISPTDLAAHMWVGKPINCPTETAASAWSRLRDTYCFLRNSLKDTIEGGPLTTAESIFGFLQSLSDRRSVVRPLCKALKGLTHVDRIQDCLMFNHYPKKMLKGKFAKVNEDDPDIDPNPESEVRSDLDWFREFETGVNMILTSPAPDKLKLTVFEELCDIYGEDLKDESVGFFAPKIQNLALIYKFYHGAIDELALRDFLLSHRDSFYKEFLEEQVRLSDGSFTGFGRVRVHFPDGFIDMVLWNDTIHALVCRDQHMIMKHVDTLRILRNSLRLSFMHEECQLTASMLNDKVRERYIDGPFLTRQVFNGTNLIDVTISKRKLVETRNKSKLARGSRIFLTKDDPKANVMVTSELKIVIKNARVSLSKETKSTISTIVSYEASKHTTVVAPRDGYPDTKMHPLASNWINGTSISPEDATALLGALSKKVRELVEIEGMSESELARINAKEAGLGEWGDVSLLHLLSFVRVTLRNRLSRLGKSPHLALETKDIFFQEDVVTNDQDAMATFNELIDLSITGLAPQIHAAGVEAYIEGQTVEEQETMAMLCQMANNDPSIYDHGTRSPRSPSSEGESSSDGFKTPIEDEIDAEISRKRRATEALKTPEGLGRKRTWGSEVDLVKPLLSSTELPPDIRLPTFVPGAFAEQHDAAVADPTEVEEKRAENTDLMKRFLSTTAGKMIVRSLARGDPSCSRAGMVEERGSCASLSHKEILGNISTTIHYTHPLWDKVIKSYEIKYNLWRIMFEDAELPKKYENIYLGLCRLINIEATKVVAETEAFLDEFD
ncbi:MAG: RNA-dependent RNA polymerase [Sanya conocephalus maculatus phenuivirus 1]|nr:MAG: RNA-dependent RNA polymerase [Sanya conocephalus maculatus phenuivirus 1]